MPKMIVPYDMAGYEKTGTLQFVKKCEVLNIFIFSQITGRWLSLKVFFLWFPKSLGESQ